MHPELAKSELQTERLQLRWLTADDSDLMLAVWNDPAFIRYVGDREIHTTEQARQALKEGVLKLYGEHGYGPYLVSKRAGGRPMGICGLFKRDNLDAPDIGFGLLPEFCRSGFAYEAAEAVMMHAREYMKLGRVKAIVSPENNRSIRLLEKLGMTVEKSIRMSGEDEDVLLYGITLHDKLD